MIIHLQELPPGLKGPNDLIYKGMVPKRMRFLHPDAAESFMGLEGDTGGFIYSDIYRSAESSLAARRIKRGLQRPGYSGHNFGFSVDLDIDEIMRSKKILYRDIIHLMQKRGWYCHRRDSLGPNEFESWHFNYLGTDAAVYLGRTNISNPRTWDAAVEARIYEAYGKGFTLTSAEVQQVLQKLRFYYGDIDGIMGPMSREAIMSFQRAWDLPDDGIAGVQTQRTLAFVAADRQVTPYSPPTQLVA